MSSLFQAVFQAVFQALFCNTIIIIRCTPSVHLRRITEVILSFPPSSSTWYSFCYDRNRRAKPMISRKRLKDDRKRWTILLSANKPFFRDCLFVIYSKSVDRVHLKASHHHWRSLSIAVENELNKQSTDNTQDTWQTWKTHRKHWIEISTGFLSVLRDDKKTDVMIRWLWFQVNRCSNE